MYNFELCDSFLSNEETKVFKDYLDQYHVDEGIWDVYALLFKSAVKGTTPLILKAYEGSELCGAAILIKCSRYGKSLFNNKLLSGFFNAIGPPLFLWMKFGCCMDMMSNPGFVKNPEKAEVIHAAMARYLGNRTFTTMIYDYTDNRHQYPGASILPALPHALVDTEGMKDINDYTKRHKNIKRKMNIFRNNGGTFEIVSGVMRDEDISPLKKCFILTAENSVTYLPYQDLYLNAALKTSSTLLNNVYYFVARLDGKFLGYQAAIKTGNCLNALHGAFDRGRDTTYHCYDILFVIMTEFAIENGLLSIDYGAVLNTTKQRMVNKIIPMSYFIYSRYPLIQKFLNWMLRKTKIQRGKQMNYITEIPVIETPVMEKIL